MLWKERWRGWEDEEVEDINSLDDLKEERRYWNLKGETLYCI